MDAGTQFRTGPHSFFSFWKRRKEGRQQQLHWQIIDKNKSTLHCIFSSTSSFPTLAGEREKERESCRPTKCWKQKSKRDVVSCGVLLPFLRSASASWAELQITAANSYSIFWFNYPALFAFANFRLLAFSLFTFSPSFCPSFLPLGKLQLTFPFFNLRSFAKWAQV